MGVFNWLLKTAVTLPEKHMLLCSSKSPLKEKGNIWADLQTEMSPFAVRST